ncbi:MAG: serine hydrolase [Armatimonadota bacterium]
MTIAPSMRLLQVCALLCLLSLPSPASTDLALSQLRFAPVPLPEGMELPALSEPPFWTADDPYGGSYEPAPGLCQETGLGDGVAVVAYGEARQLADAEEDGATAMEEAALWRDLSISEWEREGFSLVSSGDEQRVGDMRVWWAYLQALPDERSRADGILMQTVELGFYSCGIYYRQLREVWTHSPELADLATECEEALAHPEWSMARKEWALRQLRKEGDGDQVDALLRALKHGPTPSTMLYRITHARADNTGPDPLETGPESEEMRAALEEIVTDLCRQYGIQSTNISAGICDPATNEFALWNGDRMRYSACVAKLLIILGVFEEEAAGRLTVDAAAHLKLARMIRESSMPEAGEYARRVGLIRLREIAESDKYRLYVPKVGGLWHGRLFHGHSGPAYRDPVGNLTHGVTARQAMRFYWLMDHGRLVSPEASDRMRSIFLDNRVGILYNKCVKGLWNRGLTMVRKSGWYDQYQNDTLMVTGPGRHYIMVCLVTSHSNADAYLESFARRVDDFFIARGIGATEPKD